MYSKLQIISLSSIGSGVGKDTIAEVLVKEHGYTQFSWASELRREVAKCFPDAPENHRKRVSHITPSKEWETSVEFGEALRNYEDKEKIRVINCLRLRSLMITSGDSRKLVISDTRFPEEVEFLRELGASLVLVQGEARRGAFKFDNLLAHVNWDYRFNNYGELCELGERVDRMLSKIARYCQKIRNIS